MIGTKQNYYNTKKSIKYLGVIIQEKLKFNGHLKRAVGKAEERASKLAILMPIIEDLQSRKRRLLNGVINCDVRYPYTVWYRTLEIKKNVELLTRIQRKLLLRVVSTFRTASASARETPVDFLGKKHFLFDQAGNETQTQMTIIKNSTTQEWQEK